ncbi:MAG: hypothetical protein HZB46_02975 [Solirubrobacterales bacterium]|nr:hypothetical protein [Solirubrobacterales bacterium]
MLEALLWGLLACSSLVIGALIGVRVHKTGEAIGLLLGFGAGTLISAVSFELADEALRVGGPGWLALGLAGGAVTYFLGSRALGRRHGGKQDAAAAGTLLALGALLDGVPESAALGLSLAQGGEIGVALLAAVFVSNLPEAVGSSAELRSAGRPASGIIRLWAGVAVAGALASLLGYVLLDGAADEVIAVVQAFAAGAILTMLADAMMPDAFKDGGDAVGLATVVGFAVALLLSAAG